MPPKDRHGELDELRGIAVMMMILYHGAFDLEYFYGWPVLRSLGEGGDIGVLEGGWRLFARSTATLFLLLIGICFMISWERASKGAPRTRGAPTPKRTFLNIYPKYLRRGVTIFSGGMVISLVTWFVAPDAFVKFGILHLIGVSALLQPFFTQFGIWNVIPGVAIITAGVWVEQLTTTSRLLFPLGIPYHGFASLDYYPLLPWFGVILIGMAMGARLYVPDRHRILSPFSLFPYPLSLLWVGRKALILYFLHQPVLLLLLRLMLVPALRSNAI